MFGPNAPTLGATWWTVVGDTYAWCFLGGAGVVRARISSARCCPSPTVG